MMSFMSGQNPRAIHLIDIENLAGEARPSLEFAEKLRAAYEAQVGIGPDDHVIVACNHGAALAVGLAFRGSRLLVRSGPNGADCALLEVLTCENVVGRFESVVVASGDGIFADEVALLSAAGATTIVAARDEALSRRLRLAAGGHVIELQLPTSPTEPGAAATLRAA